MRQLLCVIILAMTLMACQQTKPQRPIFRGESRIDTNAVQLLTMNQQMAEQADAQLAHVATKNNYVLMDNNYWVKNLYPQNELKPTLTEGEYIHLKAVFYRLSGEQLFTHESSAQVGQIDEIQAIVNVLPLLQHGQSISMLVPWYLAFGSAGTYEVPSYENIRVELSVE